MKSTIQPFLSILFIFIFLFLVAFTHMEEVRMGYRVLKLSKEYRDLEEKNRKLNMQVARLTRPQYVENFAQAQFDLKKIEHNQIIHLTGTSR